MGSSSAINGLSELPNDVLHLILIHLHRDGSSLRAFAETCRSFHNTFHTLRLGGQFALPIQFGRPLRRHPGLSNIDVKDETTGDVTKKVVKNTVPGDALMILDTDVTHVSSAWRIRLDVFKGHRIEIGIATASAFRFDNMIERASSWSFDCFGRACVTGKQVTYGRQMLEGETITVVYDASRKTLSFLDTGGVSMGALSVQPPCTISDIGSTIHTKLSNMHIDDNNTNNINYSNNNNNNNNNNNPYRSSIIRKNRSSKRLKSQPLFPFIYFPYYKGEALSLLPIEYSVIDLQRTHVSAQFWKRPKNLPCDGHIIVSTWVEEIWYSIRVDPDRTTLGQLWKECERRHGMEMHLFELIFNGKRIPYIMDKTLRQVGITIDKRTGSCAADILLSVPHIVS